jgi:hypothetical protein
LLLTNFKGIIKMIKKTNCTSVNTTLLVAAMLLWIMVPAHAQVTTYTDEDAYLAALANTFQEGFENDAVWGSVRSSIPGEINSAPSITSMGIIWASNHTATNDITTGIGAANTGDWGIYDPDHGFATGTLGQCDVETPPPECFLHDGVSGTREPGGDTLHGVGGWIRTTTPFARINIILDGATTVDFDNIQLGTAFLFFGLIDTNGFNSFEIRETEGTVGDPKFIFADDFTFSTGLSPIPVDTFTVIVSDTSGIAITGADVAVDHPGAAPQITDADGQATFTLPVGGTYLYTIEAAGYVTQEVSSANTVVDVTLAEIDATITISGIVEDTDGAPLVGATVTAFQPDEIAVTYQALSDTGGAYTISLPTGAPNSGYTVVAKLAGFVSANQTDQAAGTVNFTGSNGLQAKTTITSVTATVAGTGVRLDITADPAFAAVTEANVTVTSAGGTGLLDPLSLTGGTISVTYSAVENFTVVIKADTSEDHDPNVGYFASSTFSYVADDPAAASARMDVDAGGGTLNLTANAQTAIVVVPPGGVSKAATFVIKQIPKTVQTSDTEGSPTFVYEVTAVDSNTGNPLTAAEIIRIEITLPIDLNILHPGDLEDGVYVIYQAAGSFSLEAGGGIPVPASQIISTNYVGDGVVGSVRFWVDHLSAFGAGAAAAVTPPPDGGGGGGGCFINAAAYDSNMGVQIGALPIWSSITLWR